MIHWYVIQSKPRNEEFVLQQCYSRNIEAYSPRIRVRKVNPRARKFQSYFPGYLFVHAELDDIGRSTLEWMPGAIGLVHFGGEPAIVPDTLISAIRTKVEEINAEDAHMTEKFKPGDPVVILSGPFAGYEAIFESRLPGSERVRVLLSFLNKQQIRTQVPVEILSPTSKSSS